MKNSKVKTAIIFCAIALILAICIAVTAVYYSYLPLIDSYLFSTRALDDETRQEGEALAEQIEAEGIVMVKNDDEALPLASSVTKVNVLGWSSTQWIMGGSGSGRSVQSQNNLNPETGFLDALEDYGISYNTEITDMYSSYLNYRPYWDGANDGGSLHSFDYEFCRLYEPSIEDSGYYTSNMKTNAISYSNTAIVVIGRVAGESNDCPKVQYKGLGSDLTAVSDSTRTYLDISTEEEALLTWAGKNFSNVIVVVNSTNAMNLGFLDEISGLDACIIVGGTGNNAATAIPKVLYGEISPSGKTVDTYVYDFSTNPSYAYSGSDGVGAYTNDDSCYPIGVQNGNVSNKTTYYDTVSYLDYVEGIYVGYKWYETADADGFWNSSTASTYWGVSGYDEVVQYPFGYGLSYSEFSYEIEDVSPAAGSTLTGSETITINVKVTNTGDYSAKDVVQAYFSVPYTSGGIEKSAITLAAYGKTTTLDPGEYQILTLEFDVSDMASYDSQEIKVSGGGYILEAGDYTITVRTDAHTVAAGTSAVTYNVASDIRYTTDPDTGAVVSNLFDSDGSDGIAVDGSDTEGEIPYLSRADFAGTFRHERAADRAMAQALKDTNLYDADDVAAWMDGHSDVAMPTTNANNGITLYNTVDGSLTIYGEYLSNPEYYDNSLWDDVLNNLTISEMRELVLHGYTREGALSSVGKDVTKSADGPSQIGSFNQTNCGVGYPTATVLAQTWNTTLAESYGLAVGKEAKNMGYDGWYAPGVNMHRSAFGGRNYEYYSEDSLLSGVMCAAVVQGAAEAGTYTYIKHIIGYDQESARDGIYCWMTEQTLREIYLKPFKIAVENGAMGLMSSYGRVGAVWSGGSEALLTDLLRTEWGFKGAVLTDYSDHKQYMNGDQMLLAGGDLWMDDWENGGSFTYLNSSYDTNGAFVTQLRNAAKHVLYCVLNVQYVSANYDETDTGTAVTGSTGSYNWITPIVIIVDVVAVAGCGVWAGLTIRRLRKNKKAQA